MFHLLRTPGGEVEWFEVVKLVAMVGASSSGRRANCSSSDVSRTLHRKIAKETSCRRSVGSARPTRCSVTSALCVSGRHSNISGSTSATTAVQFARSARRHLEPLRSRQHRRAEEASIVHAMQEARPLEPKTVTDVRIPNLQPRCFNRDWEVRR